LPENGDNSIVKVWFIGVFLYINWKITKKIRFSNAFLKKREDNG
jgi:hypothetical protein